MKTKIILTIAFALLFVGLATAGILGTLNGVTYEKIRCSSNVCLLNVTDGDESFKLIVMNQSRTDYIEMRQGKYFNTTRVLITNYDIINYSDARLLTLAKDIYENNIEYRGFIQTYKTEVIQIMNGTAVQEVSKVNAFDYINKPKMVLKNVTTYKLEGDTIVAYNKTQYVEDSKTIVSTPVLKANVTFNSNDGIFYKVIPTYQNKNIIVKDRIVAK